MITTIMVLLFLASTAAIAMPVSAKAAQLHVGPGQTYSTITAAILAAKTGDTIIVHPATYDEQLVIDKSLTLEGHGDNTIVKPSSAAKLTQVFDGLFWYGTPNTKNIAGIIVANVPDGGKVIIKNLKVDESGVTTKPLGADYLAGIFYRETGGTIDKAILMGGGAWSGYDRAYGIYLSAATNKVSVEIKGSTITNYDKNGIEAMGSKLSFNIHDNILTGRGSTLVGDEVQNGIDAGRGSAGSVNKNIISNLVYQPETWWAAAILFADSSGSAEDNTITDCQIGIIYQDGGGTASKNTVAGGSVGILGLWAQNTKAGTWTVTFKSNTVSGIKDSILPSDGAAIGASTYYSPTSLTVTIEKNQLKVSGSTQADGIYIGDIPANGPAGSITATIRDNVISGWQQGINLVSSLTSATISCNTIQNNKRGINIESAVSVTNIHVNYNNVQSNTEYGVYNGAATTLDATYNWWSSATGPSNVGPGTGDKVSTQVDYDPWLGAPYPSKLKGKGSFIDDLGTGHELNFDVQASGAFVNYPNYGPSKSVSGGGSFVDENQALKATISINQANVWVDYDGPGTFWIGLKGTAKVYENNKFKGNYDVWMAFAVYPTGADRVHFEISGMSYVVHGALVGGQVAFHQDS